MCCCLLRRCYKKFVVDVFQVHCRSKTFSDMFYDRNSENEAADDENDHSEPGDQSDK